MTNEIYVIDAPAGAGKTYQSIQYIKNNNFNKQKIIVAKTNNLANEWNEELKNIGERTKIINSTNSRHAILDIEKFLKTNTTDTLIISENAYFSAMERNIIPNKKEKVIFYDEYPEILNCISLKINATHNIITKYFVTELSNNGDHYILHIEDDISVNILLGKNDEIINTYFADLIRKIQNEKYYSVSVNKANYDNYLNGTTGNKEKLVFNITMKSELFSGFGEFFMLGASCKDKLLPLVLKDLTFVNKNKDFNITQTKHINGNRLHIFYLTNSNNWSETFLNKKDINEITNWDKIIKFVNTIEDNTLVFTNEKRHDDIKNENIKIMTPCAIGINSLSHYNVACWLATLNPSKEELNIRHSQGITTNELYICRTKYAMYQALNRTSIRNRNDMQDVIWIVPTKYDAEYLTNFFLKTNQPSIAPFENLSGGKGINFVQGKTFFDSDVRKEWKKFTMNEVKKIKKFRNEGFYYTFTNGIYGKNTTECQLTNDEFIEFMLSHEEDSLKTEGQMLITGKFNKSVFSRNGGLTQDNHKYSSCLVFDFDKVGNDYKNHVIHSLKEANMKSLVRDTKTEGSFHVYIFLSDPISGKYYTAMQEIFQKEIFGNMADKATKNYVQKIHIDKGKVDCVFIDGEEIDVLEFLYNNYMKQHFLVIHEQENIIKETKATDNKYIETNYTKAKEAVTLFNNIDTDIFGLIYGLRYNASMSKKEIEDFCFSEIPYFIGNPKRHKKLIKALDNF